MVTITNTQAYVLKPLLTFLNEVVALCQERVYNFRGGQTRAGLHNATAWGEGVLLKWVKPFVNVLPSFIFRI